MNKSRQLNRSRRMRSYRKLRTFLFFSFSKCDKRRFYWRIQFRNIFAVILLSVREGKNATADYRADINKTVASTNIFLLTVIGSRTPITILNANVFGDSVERIEMNENKVTFRLKKSLNSELIVKSRRRKEFDMKFCVSFNPRLFNSLFCSIQWASESQSRSFAFHIICVR